MVRGAVAKRLSETEVNNAMLSYKCGRVAFEERLGSSTPGSRCIGLRFERGAFRRSRCAQVVPPSCDYGGRRSPARNAMAPEASSPVLRTNHLGEHPHTRVGPARGYAMVRQCVPSSARQLRLREAFGEARTRRRLAAISTQVHGRAVKHAKPPGNGYAEEQGKAREAGMAPVQAPAAGGGKTWTSRMQAAECSCSAAIALVLAPATHAGRRAAEAGQLQ